MNTVVISESSVRAKRPEDVPAILRVMGLTLLSLPISVAVPAAKAFALYLSRLKREGVPSAARSPLPDFFIGAHAEAENLTLVTRNPDRIRTYFPHVRLIIPARGAANVIRLLMSLAFFLPTCLLEYRNLSLKCEFK